MRLRRDRLKLTTTLRETSARSGPPSATVRPGNYPAIDRPEKSGRPLRNRIQAMKNKCRPQVTGRKKTANGRT